MPELLSVHGRCPRCSQVLIVPAGQLQNVFRCARCQYRAAASALVDEARKSPPRLAARPALSRLGSFDEDTDDQHTRVVLPGGPDDESERALEAILVPDGSSTSRPPPPAQVLQRFDQGDSEQTRLHMPGTFGSAPPPSPSQPPPRSPSQPPPRSPSQSPPRSPSQPPPRSPTQPPQHVPAARPSPRPAPMQSGGGHRALPGAGRSSRDATLLGVAPAPAGLPPPAPAPLTRFDRVEHDADDQATRLHLPDALPPAREAARPALRDQTLIGVAPSALPELQRFDRVTEDAEDQHTRLVVPVAYEDEAGSAGAAAPAAGMPGGATAFSPAAAPVLRSPVAPRPEPEPELPLTAFQRFGRFSLQLSRSLEHWLHDRRTPLLLTLAALSALVGPALDALLGGPRHGPSVIVSNLVLFFLWTLGFAWLGKLRNEWGAWDPTLVWSRFWTSVRLLLQDLQGFARQPVALRYRVLGELAGALGFAGLAMASMLTISQLVWGWPGTDGGLLTGRVWGGALLAISVIALRRAQSVPPGFVAPQEITAPAVAHFPAVLDLSVPLNLPSPSGMTPLHQVLEVLAEWEPREWPNQDSYIAALERHFLRRMGGAHVERERRVGTERAEGTAHFLINESLLIEVVRGFDADTAELLDTRMRALARVWRGKPALIVAFDAHRSAMFAGAGTPKLEALHQAYPMLTVRMPSARMSLL